MRALLLALLLALPATAQSAYDFLLINATGGPVTQIYASPHEERNWSNNLLGSPLPDGQSSEILVRPDPDSFPESWDFMLVFPDGQSSTLAGIRLEDLSRLTVGRDGSGRLTATQD